MIEQRRIATTKGVPQGGPLSPVLSKVVLNELGWEFERRGHAFACFIHTLGRLFAKSQTRTGIRLRLTDHRKASRKLAAAIFYGKKAEKDALYPQLVHLAKKVVKQSDRAVDQVKAKSLDPLSFAWIEEVLHYRRLLERVIDQAVRRVFNQETVPAGKKIVSLFEPHTDIIVKANRGVEYGHKLNLSTNKHGLITAVMLEQGNPKDSKSFMPLLKHTSDSMDIYRRQR